MDFPEVSKDAENLLRWVEKYFTSRQFPSEAAQGLNAIKTTVGEALRNAGPIVVTERMPLVLQHDGHSRTIVGFEKSKNGKINLLIFDPGKSVTKTNFFATTIEFAFCSGEYGVTCATLL